MTGLSCDIRSVFMRKSTIVLCALVGFLALGGCDDKNNAYVPPPPQRVQVAAPLQQQVTNYFELTGNTAPFNTVDIEARVQGFLQSVDYVDGSFVKAGQPLFAIEHETYQAQLDQANASLVNAQAEKVGAQQSYDRQLNLIKQQVTTQQAVDSAKASLDEANAAIMNAQANIALATINLGYTQVTAPFDGIVTNHLVDVGALVGVGGPTKLATIVQSDPLYAYFNVSEPQVLSIKKALAKQGRTLKQEDLPSIPVEIGLQGEEGYPHKGHLDYVAPQVDPNTGTLTVRGVIDNKDRSLLPGLFVRVRVPVGKEDNALLVRDDALGTGQQGSYVLVLNKENVVEQRVVKPGAKQGALRVIETGLAADELVVTQGTQKAVPGNKVEPQKVAMAQQTPG